MALLITILKNPERARHLCQRDWDVLIRQARHANLLGRLYRTLESFGELPFTQARPHHHLLSGSAVADRQHLIIKHEVGLLHQTFSRCNIPFILLKGAAYVVAGLPAARGRVFADIDILVPRAQLANAESALMLTGWVSMALDAYDQRYYRQWMHELPAMQHMFRGTTLDVHHTILPPTSRLKPDPALLIEASIELPGMPGVRILCPADMVLHSATHLFHEGEPDNLLRDLTDLDELLRYFGAQDGFWNKLTTRAKLLQLGEPLRLALRYTTRLLDTPVPAEVLQEAGALEDSGIRQKLLDAIYLRVLQPQHSSTADALSPVARKLLYIRSHWQRMPPHLLACHLGHKALFPHRVASPQRIKDEKAH
ncbi:MAG: hypothetical protein H6R07_2062 [Proteobacteria bacterium]|nr:hypothetical protein [Pseudomonadota bacterium]